jgi:hypothetical protein
VLRLTRFVDLRCISNFDVNAVRRGDVVKAISSARRYLPMRIKTPAANATI